MEYLNEVRLERAKEFMDTSDRKLKEIIDQSGFTSYPYFFSLFKRNTDDPEGISEKPELGGKRDYGGI